MLNKLLNVHHFSLHLFIILLVLFKIIQIIWPILKLQNFLINFPKFQILLHIHLHHFLEIFQFYFDLILNHYCYFQTLRHNFRHHHLLLYFIFSIHYLLHCLLGHILFHIHHLNLIRFFIYFLNFLYFYS